MFRIALKNLLASPRGDLSLKDGAVFTEKIQAFSGQGFYLRAQCHP
jgi:hypothetical protein